MTLSFNAQSKQLTMTDEADRKNSWTIASTNTSAYLFFGGAIVWWNLNNPTAVTPPGPGDISITFKSMSLPNLTPEIYDVTLYRADGKTVIGKDDTVQKGEKVQVQCTVRNANSKAGSEQYPMHVKLANTTEHPTRGLSPFADTSHPVQVKNGNGEFKTVATAPGDDTISGTNGVPITLTGSTPTTVAWWAEISSVEGGAVTLSQELIEDSFQGKQYSTVELVDERPLLPAPGDADPDDPSSWGTPGTDYHYTRLPAANANGWNKSPVTVTFYPGDYNEMQLTPSEGAAKKLVASDPAWTRSDDTAGISLSAQAKNTSTNAVSTQRAGTVKIDTSAPRIERDAALSAWTINDTPTDPAKAVSGVWRLYRSTAAGAVAANARAASFRDFPLTGGDGDQKGEATQTVGNLPNGYYVAEDAAGNRSAPVKVSDTLPPTAERPDPDAPDAPEPAGPPVDPSTPVPDPEITDDGEGLRHAVINETISELIDPAAPAFGGSLDAADAEAIMDYRYALTSHDGDLTVTTELLDASGAPLDALPTDKTGECLIRRVATDAQGNTTTINLRYCFIRDKCPVVRPLKPTDPTDPEGPSTPGDPLAPDGPVTLAPDGTQRASVSCEATEAVTRGTMDDAGAIELLRRHFALQAADGTDATLEVRSIQNTAGKTLSTIDLSRAADYRITYLLRDGEGNETTINLTYHLIASTIPGVIVTPDPGTDPNPQPGDDPLNPRPRPLDPVMPPTVAPDGTQHAVMEDLMQVPVQDGVRLTEDDVRELLERRYTFTPANGEGIHELSLVLADAQGRPVQAIDRSQPASWRITYKVSDTSGNTITLHLRYNVVADAPSVSIRPGDDDPDGEPTPLPPSSVTVDDETALTHAVVEDHLVVGTHRDPVTAAAMEELFAERYELKSALADGTLTRGPIRLTDAQGNEVDSIDRSVPGTWYAEQLITDSAGNTTLIRLTYEVQRGGAGGSVSSSGDGGSAGGVGAGSGDGNAKASGWASRLRELPQTGGLFGSCPLHAMFVLLMLLTSAYGLMRLRQEKDDRKESAYETA